MSYLKPLRNLRERAHYFFIAQLTLHYNFAITSHNSYSNLLDDTVIVLNYALIILLFKEVTRILQHFFFYSSINSNCSKVLVLWRHLLVSSVIAFWEVGTQGGVLFFTPQRSVMGDSPTPVSKYTSLSQGVVMDLC